MKKIITILFLSAVIAACGKTAQSPTTASEPQSTAEPATLPDYKNAAYLIEGSFVTLQDGSFETEAAPGSADKLTTRYFGNEAIGDLNGDGRDDVAFLLTQTTGGSGTFFYVVAALQTASGVEGTNAIFLGDRIAPQTTSMENGIITVNYADRNPGEPFTTQPSLGVSKYFKVSQTTLTEASVP